MREQRRNGMERRGGRGRGGEGLTAINFAKIGAYAVAGRQSNPSSAHRPLPFPPYVEMRVQLDDRRARSDALLVAMLAKVPACSFCNYLPDTQDTLFLFYFFSRCFPPFSAVNRISRNPRFRFPPSNFKQNAFLQARERAHNKMAVFQPPTMSSSRHQDFIAKLHQVAWVASAGRCVVKSSGGASVAVSFVISRTTRVGEGRERAEVGKKEFRHSARRPERTQQWPRINIITVRLG